MKTRGSSKTIAIGIILCLTLIPLAVPFCADATADEDASLLFDEGNGSTRWFAIAPSGTYLETVAGTLEGNGHRLEGTGASLTIDGKTAVTVGAADSGGSFTVSGTTGVTVTSKWTVYIWNGGMWSEATDLGAAYASEWMAVGFYPEGCVPAESPDHPSSWKSVAGDAENSGRQYADLSSDEGEVAWSIKNIKSESGAVVTGSYSSILAAGGYAFVKYGGSSPGYTDDAAVVCHDLGTGEIVWEFWYKRTYYETSTNLIVGDNIYIQSSLGQIYKIDWREGPGEDNSGVTTFDGEAWGSATQIPVSTGNELNGLSYGDGPGSLVCDSGAIYTISSNGMFYCFDLDLRLIWSYQTDGVGYFTSPTVHDGYVSAGMYDGHLYILDQTDGRLIVDRFVYAKEYRGGVYGCVSAPCFMDTDDGCTLFVTFNDGLGMSAKSFGMAVYGFDGVDLEEIAYYMGDFGNGLSNYLTPYHADGFDGVCFMAYNGLYRMDADGSYELINTMFAASMKTKSSLVLVNDEFIFISCYSPGNGLFAMDLAGRTVGGFDAPISSYSMAPVTVVDGMFLSGTDDGVYAVSGSFEEYIPESPGERMEPWKTLLNAAALAIVAPVSLWAVLRYGLGWERPFAHIKGRIMHFFFGEDYTHNTKSRHRLWAVLALGGGLTVTMALVSLCVGSETTLSLGEMADALIGAIRKGGRGLTYNEMLIFDSRLPRTLAALGVGIGLSVAGAIYQAIIRNPLVDPYIMGVSAGAGTAAVAVIAFDFTFFGLFGSQSLYTAAIAAMIGGLAAFFCTMLLAEKARGTSINYVLAGVIVGLVFSAIQSLMMVSAGNSVGAALTWLYGSFTAITWSKVWMILVPAVSVSMAVMVWAKEFNLILLGQDQARQMGLNARLFSRTMLVIASVLTSICVAFVGIIGFVGLVIPHLCRMMLGGDHRLVLPASLAFGGALMIAADLLSRVLLTGFELPVGAITTVIGVPVFAYLLIKRGKMYEG